MKGKKNASLSVLHHPNVGGRRWTACTAAAAATVGQKTGLVGSHECVAKDELTHVKFLFPQRSLGADGATHSRVSGVKKKAHHEVWLEERQ